MDLCVTMVPIGHCHHRRDRLLPCPGMATVSVHRPDMCMRRELRSTQRLATTGIQREGERRRPFDRLTVLIDSASATTVPPARTFESEVNLWPPLDTGAIFRRFCIAVYRMHCIIRTGFSCSFQQALDHQNWTTWWDTTPLRVHTLVMVNSFSKRIAPRICSSAHAGLHRPRRNIVRAIGVWI